MPEIFPSDLALFELQRGERNEWPPEIVRDLVERGCVELDPHGRPMLTATGEARAQRLAPAEHDLRLQCVNAAAGRPSFTTAGGPSSLQIGTGGAVKIKS